MPHLPSPLQAFARLQRQRGGRPLALFLDFDGTLAGFRPRPEWVRLPVPSRRLLAHLAQRHFVAVVSGRDLPDVRRRVGLPQLWYAGSHGLDLRGPCRAYQPAQALRPNIDAATRALLSLEGIEGVQVECKRFVVAVHTRRLRQRPLLGEIEARVTAVRERVGGLMLLRNAEVLELRPALSWHKGSAVNWLLAEAAPRDAWPLFIGDDTTDEDGFRAVAESGAGVLVAAEARPTAAGYRLRALPQVIALLQQLLDAYAPPPLRHDHTAYPCEPPVRARSAGER